MAAEAPGSRGDLSVPINNAATGNPTQITVYANGSASRIHDVAPGVWWYVEDAVSTAVNIAAAAIGHWYQSRPCPALLPTRTLRHSLLCQAHMPRPSQAAPAA